MLLVKLFFTFFGIGAVAFGGGYAMLPLFERMIVEQQGWLDRSLFLDMIAISQMTPGPIAINSATFIGFQIRGVIGALVATVGMITIPVILISLVSVHRESFKNSKVVQAIFRGLRPALVGLIFASVFSLTRDAILDLWGIILFFVFFALLAVLRVHPILVILISAVAGLIIYA